MISIACLEIFLPTEEKPDDIDIHRLSLQDIEEHDLWGAVALNELHSKVLPKTSGWPMPATKTEICLCGVVCCEADNVERAKKKGKKSEKSEKDKSADAKAPTLEWQMLLNSGC